MQPDNASSKEIYDTTPSRDDTFGQPFLQKILTLQSVIDDTKSVSCFFEVHGFFASSWIFLCTKVHRYDVYGTENPGIGSCS